MATKSEYKRPAGEYVYQQPTIATEDLPPDFTAIISLVLGILGLMMRYKIASWIALFTCIVTLANMRWSEADMKQVLTCVMFSVLGLVMNYVVAAGVEPLATA
eukprot:NODE_7121_length_464_cov_7.860534_g6955_i0.p1 GENE.NODE_7121_length_464_cov_7.860534_g6955_i0~~NODE_7121_length_464_cov_7.860534_g6955_i0.p1  ORF type:complete len:115 (-),score=47.45 NODE_7121_length_464_cov_7.860534_g6955_i0:118-426(-)